MFWIMKERKAYLKKQTALIFLSQVNMLQAPAFRGLYVILLFHTSQAQYQWGSSSSTQNKLLTQTNDGQIFKNKKKK